MSQRRRRVLLTVSGTISATLGAEIAAGRRPRADYYALADAMDADVLDHARARLLCGRIGRLAGRLGGVNAMMAWTVLREARRYDIVLTDGEQVGLPYAALGRLKRRSRLPRHVMIVHVLSVGKKVNLFTGLRLGARIDALIVYASSQRDFAEHRLGVPRSRIDLTTFMVDTEFFSPTAVEAQPRRMICAAGLEFRDYETLVEAVRGVDVELVIAAASPWSKRTSGVADAHVPDNVTVVKLGFHDLRQLYADSLMVVMPLKESDFQAGITTILEAMAMGKAVVCSRTSGQTDTVVDGETGLYVPPGDAQALRAAIERLLADPDEADRLGRNGRARVVADAELSVYARRLATYVLER